MELFFNHLLIVLMNVVMNDPYSRVCVPSKLEHLSLKVFNLILGVNETIFLVQHKSYECKYGLNESVCNSKQIWNHDERQCEYVE